MLLNGKFLPGDDAVFVQLLTGFQITPRQSIGRVLSYIVNVSAKMPSFSGNHLEKRTRIGRTELRETFAEWVSREYEPGVRLARIPMPAFLKIAYRFHRVSQVDSHAFHHLGE